MTFFVLLFPASGYFSCEFQACERGGPLQGSKSPKLGKEGFGVKKLPFPSAPEKGALSQKIPIFLVVPCKEMGIF